MMHIWNKLEVDPRDQIPVSLEQKEDNGALETLLVNQVKIGD